MKEKKRSTLSYVLEWAEEKKWLYFCSVILAVCSVIAKILPYFAIGDIVNRMIDGQKQMRPYLTDIGWVIVLFGISELCHTFSTSLSHQATFIVIRNIRKKMLEKLTKIPLGRVQERGTGSLKNTMMERVDSIETTLSHILPEFTSNLLAPVLIFVYLLRIDVRMAFIALIPAGIGIIFAVGLFSGYEDSYQKTVETTKNLNDTAVEYVSGIEVIKAFSKTGSSYQKFVQAAKDNAQSFVAWMKRSSFFQAGTMVMIPYTTLTVLPFGAWFVYNGTLSLSGFVMCLILSLGLMTPLITLGSYSDDLAACGTIVNEIETILNEPEMERPAESVHMPADHSVELKHVSFAYQREEVLHDLSLRFEPDSVNAIVGPSGSGKSTIAKLIAGFYETENGEIDFGGVNEKDLSFSDRQRMIAYVSQDNVLFHTTIRENIRMGRPDATDEEVEEIARKSGCYDFIMNLENGFDTDAGSGGSHLSGGERQRICIARAMLKDAPVVILDEATAYTDPENEAVVEEAIARLVRGKTLIMIAHRLYTIQNADRIFVISHGRLEAEGTHSELMEHSSLYRNMWKSQSEYRDGEAL